MNPIWQISPVQPFFLPAKTRVLRFKYAALNIMACSASEGKKTPAADVEYLPPQQMQNRRHDKLRLTSLPFLYRIFLQ